MYLFTGHLLTAQMELSTLLKMQISLKTGWLSSIYKMGKS